MSHIRQMFDTHPVKPSSDRTKAIECITACYSCAEACNACVDACLAEENAQHMVACIRTNEDCADICLATARIVSRLTHTNKEMVGALLRACILACRISGAECAKHAEMMAHCSICSQACLHCANACEDLLAEPATQESRQTGLN